MDLGDGYSIGFIAHPKNAQGKEFVTLQLFRHAKGVAVKNQSWNRTKKVTVKAVPKAQQPKAKLQTETKISSESLL